jgi:4-amino-4-deoxy-L-arabinose transferase-like glycosyltransferase
VGLITAGALALRLVNISRVPPDPFYDAAVRSMALSWHNFFFGAFEPGGSVSIDKPPVDLWLQVASVKLFGFSSTTLKLPEVLAGTASVPLLFCAVRQIWGSAAGLAAAIVLAVLPLEVITSRSDTMDAVMMALIVLALVLIVRACRTGGVGWLIAGAASLGIAFDVKLLESIVALPGLALLAYLGLPGPRRKRALQMLLAGAAYAVVALSWLSATLLVSPHDRPFAIGSSNGSAWNAAFDFNGADRISGDVTEGGVTAHRPAHRYPQATQSERDRIPIVAPSPTRLLARVGPLSGARLGLVLLIALMLGAPALLSGRRAAASVKEDDPDGERLRRAGAAGLAVWMLAGVVLFSHMARLHPRYVEALTPAVAAMLGIGATWATSRGSRGKLIALLAALAAAVYYVERLQYGLTNVWWITLAFALGAAALAITQVLRGAAGDGRWARRLAGATIALTLAATLALPVSADVSAIKDGVTDAGDIGALPAEEQRPLSAYLRAHQGAARYELAAESATQVGSLIVEDGRPIVVLTTYNGRLFTSVPKLRALIARGEVKYALLNSQCPRDSEPTNPACSQPALWVRAHGIDISRQARLHRRGVLWLLPRSLG